MEVFYLISWKFMKNVIYFLITKDIRWPIPNAVWIKKKNEWPTQKWISLKYGVWGKKKKTIKRFFIENLYWH